MNDFMEVFTLKGHDLNFWQTIIRTILVFILTLIILRFAKKRFLGKNTAFDVVLGVIFGSVVSRAINGSSNFLDTMAAAIVLVSMHWIFSAIISRSPEIGDLLEGVPHQIIKNGKIIKEMMLKTHMREADIEESLRTEAKTEDMSKIKNSYVETNGKISIILKEEQ
ncbi:MAG: DUF421 domain-containing protein [Syntrophothermus sp.]